MFSTPNSSLRVAIYGVDEARQPAGRGCGLWPVGYAGAVAAAGATPVFLPPFAEGDSWKETLAGFDGVVLARSQGADESELAHEEAMCKYCRKYKVPLLAVDQGLHVMNTAFGGTLFLELARELPEALQHRHPPEKGSRHAITVVPGTRLCALYGDGEVVVNSEHRTGINQLARGFRVSAQALDGVIEAVETETDEWFAMGVQWLPASATASGLDIQVFRGLIDSAQRLKQAETAGVVEEAAA